MPPPSLSERYNLEEEEGERRMLQTVDDDDFEEEEDEDEDWKSSTTTDLLRRHSVSSFNTKSSPTSSTTVSYSIPSSSPPQSTDHALWKETLAKLKRTLIVSPPATPPAAVAVVVVKTPAVQKSKKRLNKFIPMPIPPRRPISQKRRSEATTQPRFNPDTNTYTRDTRSNPDHLRMISAELNMMRGRKLLSPLKPRGFLPRRKDAFIRGMNRKPSPLIPIK